MQNLNTATPLTVPTHDSNLFDRADALAKMTFELNLRAVCGHADRLERDVRKLVVCTEQDKEFRYDNEKRMVEMMREIQSVRTQMARATHSQVDIKSGFERQQQEMAEIIDGFRREMVDLRGFIDSVSSQLDQFSSPDDIDKDIQVPPASSRGMETRAMRRACKQADTQPPDQQSTAAVKPKSRIQEAINSTRRWNRDHKVTSLPDSHFTANYLKKQSQRDPDMAVLLQRSLQKRIRLRAARTSRRTLPQPRNLEELCRDVVWQDVIDMVQDVLVANGERSARLLG
ncbi:hypothetical protein G7Z17_g9092 [Cylindrodendrum hubeiense]|uniref:Uncharacterized protein n=1 Tax=Cylindrodendrum hubeiense TaxID=595255 RepID=A0A9P5LCK2_9HYPO|nr:hypothetical protein G7Z17_g9092 [Cylindrodendrum hubeiense]